MAMTAAASASRWPSAFYDIRHRVSRELHAVERNRILTGLALGYEPQGAPDFGLDRARLASPGERYAVLLHATARPDKEWPEANWIALGNALDAKRNRTGAAVGHADRSARAANASPPPCRARAFPSARRSTRSPV